MSNQTPVEGFLPHDQLGMGERPSPLRNIIIGGSFVAAAGAAAWGMYEGAQSDERVTASMPFVQEAQNAINNVDNVIKDIGEGGLVLALGTIGAVKISSRWSGPARAIDRISSKEMTNDGNHNPGRARRALRRTFAGSIPGIASVGVAVGAITGAIGTEVSEGPSRPIAAFDQFAPGESMIVQYEGAMPMVQSSVNARLTEAVRAEATRRDVQSSVLDLNLGTLTTASGESFSDLAVGTEAPAGSPLDWKSEAGCTIIPVMIDESANIAPGNHVRINGVDAEVVGSLENTSAINRVGVVMDREAMKSCIEQNPNSGDHAVVLDTDPTLFAKGVSGIANATPIPEASTPSFALRNSSAARIRLIDT